MKANVIVFEAAVFIFFVVFYQGARRALGKRRNWVFLLGAVLFSLAIETTMVLGGVKNFFWYAQNDYYKHYPLGGHIIWLGLVPLASLLLWYMVTAVSYLSANALIRKRGVWLKSAAAGGIALAFYLIIEPIAVTNHWWSWNLKSFYLIDVPVIAWLGTFIAVFLFTAAYQLTIMERADITPLTTIENMTIKRWPIKSKKITKNLGWVQLEAVYLFRLLACFVVFCAAMAPLVAVFWAIANRGQIPPGW
jgi:hypothetical protein